MVNGGGGTWCVKLPCPLLRQNFFLDEILATVRSKPGSLPLPNLPIPMPMYKTCTYELLHD